MGVLDVPGLSKKTADSLYATKRVDICIYGATASGIMAAISAWQNGKTVELINPDSAFAGMPVAGGLSYTDVTQASNDAWAIKGLAGKLYQTIWSQFYSAAAGYVSPVADYPTFFTQSLNGSLRATRIVLTQMLSETGVFITKGFRVTAVTKSGTQITSASFEDASDASKPGFTITASQFIDATYEGDLLAAAACSFTVGREANSAYGETYNGVLSPYQNNWQISPYVVEGNPASGLLPGIQPSMAAVGSGDNKVQAYSYRVNVTTAANRRKFPEPENYNPMLYEILGRQFAAGQITTLAQIFEIRAIKEGLFDMNNAGAFGTLDFIGANWSYPTATYAEREQIVKAHRDYTLGLFKFLKTDPRTPAAIFNSLAAYGLPDYTQMQSPDGFPAQLYVREARRLVGDFVQTDRHCLRTDPVTDGLCVGYYAMDSHHTQQVVVGGYFALEGNFFKKTGPSNTDGRYWVSYSVLLPKVSECTNLLVTFAVSASHAAFASIRLEPVAMQLGEAAGFAASYAIDKGVNVQAVPVDAIRDAMGVFPSGGFVVDAPPGANVPGTYNVPHGKVVTSGPWSEVFGLGSATTASIFGPTFLYDGAANAGQCSASFRFDLPASGKYNLYAFYPHASNRFNHVPLTIKYGGLTDSTKELNQQATGNWTLVGTFAFTANDPDNNSVTVLNTGSGSGLGVAVDAFCLQPV